MRVAGDNSRHAHRGGYWRNVRRWAIRDMRVAGVTSHTCAVWVIGDMRVVGVTCDMRVAGVTGDMHDVKFTGAMRVAGLVATGEGYK